MATKAYTPHRILKYAIGAMLVFAFAVRLWGFVHEYLILTPINQWGFTEYLINYQGGFVRRGIIGEGLLSLAKTGLSGDTIVNLIRAVSVACYAAMLAFFLYQFRRHRWNWWIILAPVFMGYVICIVRKDFMQELLLIGILMMMRGSPRSSCHARLWGATALCVLELFIHEAIIFWGMPIVGLLIATSPASKWEKTAAISIIAATFAILSIFKGNPEAAWSITESWQPWFPDLQHDMWNSIGAIGWNLGWTAHFHFTSNFCSPTIGWMKLPLQIAAFSCYAYMICNFVYAFSPRSSARETLRLHLTAVYILTAACMIPLFTVLSVDYSRLYQYLAVTSFAAVIVIPGARLDRALPRCLRLLTVRITDIVDRYFTPSKGIMVALLFLADINGIHHPYDPCVGTLVSLCQGITTIVQKIAGL